MSITGALMAGASIWGGYQQSLAARSQADYEATNAEINAMFNRRAAEDAITRGNEEAGRHMKGVRKFQGSQRAALAASGVNVDVGSASDIQQETGLMGALDMLTIQNNAFREALGYKLAASQNMSEAQFAQIAGNNRSNSALLSGGMNAVSSYMQAKHASQG